MQVIESLSPELSGLLFDSLESTLDYVTKALGETKLVLVIDELPYWAEKDTALLSILQKYIDTQWLDKELMLILCGSSLSFMENKVLSEKSPVFGRRNSQIKLEAFNYREAALFVPDYSPEDAAICYGVTGGVAKYLSLINPDVSIDENIKKLFFQTDGYLYDETRNLLTQEFSDITIVNNIIEQIANGSNTVTLIAGKIHEKEPTVLYSLEKLISAGLIEKRRCITEEKNKKKTQYVLKDHMFRFWYAFIPKAHSVIEIGGGALYYEKAVKPNIHEFMGDVFEEMCRYYTLEQGIQSRFNTFITKVGNWWGVERICDNNGNYKNQATDIDIVAISDIDKTAVVGECKFRNEKINKGIYETLLRRESLISGKYAVVKRILFSLNGFTEWFGTADCEDTLFITLEDMYKT